MVEPWSLAISGASAILGFLVAFFAEPVKTYFNNRSKKATLRNALYSEMALLYNRLTQLSKALSEGELDDSNIQWAISELARFDCYNYVRTEGFLLFYQLEEAPAIDAFYGCSLLLTREYSDLDSVDFPANVNGAIELLEDLTKQGQINKKLLLQRSDIATRELLEKRLD